jgi:cell division protein FtsW
MASHEWKSVPQVPDASRKQLRTADKWFLFAVLSLMFMSLVVVYSASAFWAELRFQSPDYLLRSHLFKVVAGVVLIFVFAKIDYHSYQKYALYLLAISILLLVVALAQRVIIKGASRWIHLGVFSFEPSEIARVAVLLFLAAYLTEKSDVIQNYRNLFKPLGLTGAVAGLIVLQPNFSTASIVLLLVGILFFAGGVKKTHLAFLVAGVIVIAVVVLAFEPYRVARVEGWMTRGPGNYQACQSIIGFGNGGIFGVGPGNSRQRNLFLPESYGDFIYSIIGEEYGLWGSILVMLIFLFIAFRGTAIAKLAPDRFGSLVATGITCAICIYAFVNAAVAVGLFPTTGLPMPFVSYGGTAMIVNSAAVGMVLNISKQIPEPAIDQVTSAKVRGSTRHRIAGDEPVVGRIYS